MTNLSQLWGEQYNRSVSDILTVQEDITREISRNLRLELTGEEEELLTEHATENSEAYQLYRSHLRPGGLLVFQVSNRYLDLGAVVRGLAEEAGHQTHGFGAAKGMGRDRLELLWKPLPHLKY